MAVRILVRCVGHKSVTLRQGDTLKIGRHHSNDLVLADGTVSRFHAAIAWDKDEDRPWIVDNNSANGVELDDEFIDERAPLSGNNQIGIGDFTLVLQLKGAQTGQTRAVSRTEAEESSALLHDEDVTVVRLFSESLKKIKGRFTDTDRLKRLFLHLEDEERTGTLSVQEGARTSKVMFGQGKIITASHKDTTGLVALTQIMNMTRGAYEFGADIEPSEKSLNLSAKEFLEREGDPTQRLRKPRSGP